MAATGNEVPLLSQLKQFKDWVTTQISDSAPAVDIVKTTSHKTTYTKDTLEVVVDSTGKVTSMYFISV